MLNTFDDRTQNVVIANYYRQDFIWPGYTAQVSFHYNQRSRPRPSSSTRTASWCGPIRSACSRRTASTPCYLGWAGDGHINRFNISHAFYWALGHDDLNPLAGQAVTINAQMAAVEVSYDRDWMRFRTSVFWASGDDDINDGRGDGLRHDLRQSELRRRRVQLLAAAVDQAVRREPDRPLQPGARPALEQDSRPDQLREPGPVSGQLRRRCRSHAALRLISNANFLWFDRHATCSSNSCFRPDIDRHIGTDLSLGVEYRPLLNNNVIFVGGVSALIPGSGFKDLYNPIVGDVDTLFASFVQVALTY